MYIFTENICFLLFLSLSSICKVRTPVLRSAAAEVFSLSYALGATIGVPAALPETSNPHKTVHRHRHAVGHRIGTAAIDVNPAAVGI